MPAGQVGMPSWHVAGCSHITARIARGRAQLQVCHDQCQLDQRHAALPVMLPPASWRIPDLTEHAAPSLAAPHACMSRQQGNAAGSEAEVHTLLHISIQAGNLSIQAGHLSIQAGHLSIQAGHPSIQAGHLLQRTWHLAPRRALPAATGPVSLPAAAQASQPDTAAAGAYIAPGPPAAGTRASASSAQPQRARCPLHLVSCCPQYRPPVPPQRSASCSAAACLLCHHSPQVFLP
jgi:hypothetical protein